EPAPPHDEPPLGWVAVRRCLLVPPQTVGRRRTRPRLARWTRTPRASRPAAATPGHGRTIGSHPDEAGNRWSPARYEPPHDRRRALGGHRTAGRGGCPALGRPGTGESTHARGAAPIHRRPYR